MVKENQLAKTVKMYKEYFANLDVDVLKGLLNQYIWEEENNLDSNITKIKLLKSEIAARYNGE